MELRLPYFIRKQYYRFKLFRKLFKYYEAPWDVTNTLFHFSFESFCEFYVNGGLDIVCWDSNDEDKFVRKEMDELYQWYTKERFNREEEIEVVSDTWSEHEIPWFRTFCGSNSGRVRNKYAEYLFKLFIKLEEEYEKQKQDNLIRLIKIRNFLST